jgi:hypothetical protein
MPWWKVRQRGWRLFHNSLNCWLSIVIDSFPVQSNKLLLTLASTFVLGIGPRRDQLPYFCSLQDFYAFWNGASSSNRRGAWLLLVSPSLQGVTRADTQSLTGPLLHTDTHTHTRTHTHKITFLRSRTCQMTLSHNTCKYI